MNKKYNNLLGKTPDDEIYSKHPIQLMLESQLITFNKFELDYLIENVEGLKELYFTNREFYTIMEGISKSEFGINKLDLVKMIMQLCQIIGEQQKELLDAELGRPRQYIFKVSEKELNNIKGKFKNE